MNGLYVLVLAATIVGACYFIPRAVAHDRLWRELDSLDDEGLAAFLDENPDMLDWRGWR
jgi:hypothetical protein